MIYLTTETYGGNHGHNLVNDFGVLTTTKVFGFTYVNPNNSYLNFGALGDGELERKQLNSDMEKIVIKGNYDNGIPYEKLCEIFEPIMAEHMGKDCQIILDNHRGTQVRTFPQQAIEWYAGGLIETDVYGEVVSEANEKFMQRWANKKSYFRDDEINISVHVGRGIDYRKKFIKKCGPSSPHYQFPISYFDNIVTQLQNHYHDRKHTVRIYTEKLNSEETVETFKNRENVELCIGKNRSGQGHIKHDQVHDIFYHFVMSDILVSCNSAFSLAASHYRTKPTIYHPNGPWRNFPTDRYITTDVDGSIDVGLL